MINHESFSRPVMFQVVKEIGKAFQLVRKLDTQSTGQKKSPY